jgi:large subunit ribosomal protein L10
MAISRQKKESIVRDVEGVVGGAESIVFVRFKGLPVAETTAMRAALREQGIKYHVAKKTLMKRVLATAGFQGDLPSLDGEVAIVAGKDPIAPAREIYAFVKRYKEAIGILGGVFEGRYLNGPSMTEIATIPSRETLIAQVAQLLNSPISRLAIGLNQIAEKRSV